MKVNTIVKIFFVNFFVCFHATAQTPYQNNFKFDHLFPGDNMRENSVTCFLQDRQGFIWIGTKGGLFRYDGYNFLSFKMEPKEENSLSDDFIRCIVEYSRDEFILIGTNSGGLNVFDKKTGKFFRFLHREDDNTSISDNSVWDIVEDHTGKIWLATGRGLNLFNFEKRSFKQFPFVNNRATDKDDKLIRCLYIDSRKKLWVGTGSRGLFYFDVDSKIFHRIPDDNAFSDLKTCDVWSIMEDGKGNLWVGTYNRGIYVVNRIGKERKKLINLNERNGLGNFHIVTIARDLDDTIWVGTWGGGLLWYDENRHYFRGYKNKEDDPESISSNLVLSFFEDNASTFWIGTHAGGINIYQPQKWKFMPYKFDKIKKNTVHFNSARSIYFDDQSQLLYVGTSFGLYEFLFSKKSQLVEKLSGRKFAILRNVNINAIWPGRKNHYLWLGTNNGLFRWNTVENKYRQFKIQLTKLDKLDEGIIIRVVGDNKGFLWIITATGKLYRFSPEEEKFVQIKIETIDPHDERAIVFSILIEQNGKTYLGTHKGVMCGDVDTLKFRALFSDSGKSNIMKKNNITLYRDAHDLLWIGSWGSGLYCYDEKTDKLRFFTVSDGLPSNYISAIIEDKNGFLYIGTDNGVSRFDSDKDEFINFSVDDGLHGNHFENSSCYKTQRGVIFLGGINGFSYFHPEELRQNRFLPPVHITDFEILHEKSNIDQNIMFKSSVKLTYKMNSFAIEFVTLNFINAFKNRYLYKLEGYDREWQEATTHRKVTYKNIPPGKYTFRVIASNNDSYWNEKGDFLSIYITPPFWQRLYFKIALILLLGLTIYYNLHRRFALLRRETEARRLFTRSLIENQEKERKRIAAELHDSLGQDLLLIKNLTKILLKGETKDNKGRLHEIDSVAGEAISNIRQIAFALHPYQLESLGLSDCIRQMIKKLAGSTEIHFSYRIDKINNLLPKKHEINVYRIAQEILNNILKHSKAKNVRIEIRCFERFIKMIFSDDGVGFDYHQVREIDKGFGFSDLKERVEILKGQLEVESNPAKGTEIVVSIPIKE